MLFLNYHKKKNEKGHSKKLPVAEYLMQRQRITMISRSKTWLRVQDRKTLNSPPLSDTLNLCLEVLSEMLKVIKQFLHNEGERNGRRERNMGTPILSRE